MNAIAKGVRKTGSRFGGRLEPLTHVALMLHEGRGDLHTVSGADIIRSHAAVRERTYNLAVGQIGAEAVLKLNTEPERSASDVCRPEPVSDAARDLDGERRGRSGVGSAWPRVSAEAVDAERLSATSHRLRVVWLARAAGRATRRRQGGAVCDECLGQPGTFAVEMESLTAIEQMLAQPLGEPRPGLRATRDALRVLERTYEYHGGFQLRTLRA